MMIPALRPAVIGNPGINAYLNEHDIPADIVQEVRIDRASGRTTIHVTVWTEVVVLGATFTHPRHASKRRARPGRAHGHHQRRRVMTDSDTPGFLVEPQPGHLSGYVSLSAPEG